MSGEPVVDFNVARRPLVIAMQRALLALSTLLLATLLRAQAATDELAAVNARFAGDVRVKIDRRDRLVFDFFDASGRFRQDVVPVEHLDPQSIHYSPEEDAVIIGCRSGHARCISKEVFKLNTVRTTGRTNLPRPPSDEGGHGTMDALHALVLAAQQRLASARETR